MVVMIDAKPAVETPGFKVQLNTASFVKTNGTLLWAQVCVYVCMYVSFKVQLNTASFVKTNGTLLWAQVCVCVCVCVCEF
jgi:hypothetical protein